MSQGSGHLKYVDLKTIWYKKNIGAPPKSNILHFFTVYFISYQYVFQMLEVAGALTHDSFMTISFPQGEGPHVQPPTALLR